MTSSSTDTLIDVTMPQMGVSVAEGTVVGWRVGVGDAIAAEQTICDISTDKIDTEVPAPVSGVVAEILVDVDQTVDVGTVMARIAVEGGGASNGDGAPPGATGGARPDAGATGAGTARSHAGAATRRWWRGSPPSTTSTSPRSRARAAAAACASRMCWPWSTATAMPAELCRTRRCTSRARTGPIPRPPPQPLPLSRPRRPPSPVATACRGCAASIGERMKQSLDTAATCTTWIEVDMSRVEAARATLGVTALAFVARATVDALREHPALNAWLNGEDYARPDDVNLGIAVSLGEDGLIVPVIHKAQELSVEGLAARIRDIARRARARELSADDVLGGTFTITNPGQFGSIMATPIINQPQVGILDFEAVIKRPVVVTDSDGNDSIAIRPMTIMGLSWDHRALDGALSAQFLATVKRRLESLPS